MKNIQVIDGAENCAYSVCSASNVDFAVIFPAMGQDVEFAEDLSKRLGRKRAGELIQRATTRRIEKSKLRGIHGTLFFGLLKKKRFYPNKREDDFDHPNMEVVLKQPRERRP